MRTTVTLDEDVAMKLKDEMRLTGRSFKEAVNAVLRRGFAARREMGSVKPFKVRPRDLGTRPGIEFDNIEELLDQVEGPDRR